MVLGEYTGKNGRKYKWEKGSSRSGWFVTEKEPVTGIWICSFSQPSTEDWPAAKAALDALIEAESEGWVEIDDNARIQRDGSDPQVRHEDGVCVWRALTIDKRWPKAYRKGREVAEAEQAEMRGAVWELVEAVERASDLLCSIIARPSEGRQLKRIVVLAKTLEAKL